MKSIASLFLAAAFIAGPSAAAFQTWTGAGPDNNWSTGANWAGGVPPPSSPTTQILFDSGAPRKSPIVDAPWTVNELAFNLTAYTFSGQTITFDGAGAGVRLDNAASITLSNPIVLAAPTGIGSCFSSFTADGAISGPGSLDATFGNPVVTLRGANTYTGGTTIFNSTLNLRGSMLGPVSIASGPIGISPCNHEVPGILTGSGTVNGAVSLNGGDLVPDPVLNTGNLSFQAGSLSIAINGPARGTQYATVNVTGTVGVPSATLRLLGSYTPVPGDVFTIIVNDGIDPVVGTFAGLPEGAAVTFNGVPLRISYAGGTGNDVTLSVAAAAAAPLPVPTLSQWALVLLASVVIGVGMVRLHRAG